MKMPITGKQAGTAPMTATRNRYCVLNEAREVVSEGTLATTRKGLNQVFGKMVRGRVPLEVTCHSPWVSRHFTQLAYKAIVPNARKVRLITDSSRKNDRMNAGTLARLAPVHPDLLSAIRHRREQARGDLMTICARAELVEVWTMLVNSVRGLAKSYGDRLPSCSPH
jgi:transposase